MSAPLGYTMLMIASSSLKSKFEGRRKFVDDGVNHKGPLPGIKYDLKAFLGKFKQQQTHYIETSQDEQMLLSIKYILNWCVKYFSQAKYETCIFYSGHGHQGGDLAVETVQRPQADRLLLETIVNLWTKHRPMQQCHLYLFMDSCYSGAWAYKLGDMGNKNISIFASSDRNQTSIDINGGMLFKCILGPQKDIDSSWETLKQYQCPVFINKSDRVSKLEKDHVKMLNKSLANVKNIKSAGNQFTANAAMGQAHLLPNPQQFQPAKPPQQNQPPKPPQQNQPQNQNQPPKPPQQQNHQQQPPKPPQQQVIINNDDINQVNNVQIINGQIYINGIKIQQFDIDQTNNPQLQSLYQQMSVVQQEAPKHDVKVPRINPQAQPPAITYPNGQKYQGQQTNNKRNGKGIMEYASGTVYDGEWKNDLKHGTGICYYATNERYEGTFVNDKRQGKGKYFFADGKVYDGDWKNNSRNGQGTLNFGNGDIYEGQWQNDKQNGHGTYTYQDGSVYTGQFKDDMFNGTGTLQYENGNRYQGQWFEDMMHGHGVFQADGDVYDGEYVEDYKSGQGIYTYSNGDQYQGGFENDLFNGDGTYFYADGTQVSGNWIDGELEGEGDGLEGELEGEEYGDEQGVY